MQHLNSNNKDISRQELSFTCEKPVHSWRIMASTMSVDEYFDALIDQVREDYASL